jgi:hypothetical protein
VVPDIEASPARAAAPGSVPATWVTEVRTLP